MDLQPSLLSVGAALAWLLATWLLRLRYPASWRPRTWPTSLSLLLVVVCGLGGSLGVAPWIVGILLVSGVFCAVRDLRRGRQAQAIERALEGLGEPEVDIGAAASQVTALVQDFPANARVRAALWLHAASKAYRAGRDSLTLTWLGQVHGHLLDPIHRVALAQMEAALSLGHGDHFAARRILATVARPVADPTFERAIAALDLVLDAIQGAPAAEPRIRLALLRESHPSVTTTLRTGHAHALAALGRVHDARSLLRTFEPQQLARIVRHAGPASALARDLHHAKTDPAVLN